MLATAYAHWTAQIEKLRKYHKELATGSVWVSRFVQDKPQYSAAQLNLAWDKSFGCVWQKG